MTAWDRCTGALGHPTRAGHYVGHLVAFEIRAGSTIVTLRSAELSDLDELVVVDREITFVSKASK